MWVDNDLTKFAGGGLASVGGVEGSGRPSLDAYSQGDNSQHVNFTDETARVHELYRSPDPAAQWVDNDLTGFAHGTPAHDSGPIDGYSQGDGSQHVNFIDDNGQVHELYNP
jgi:hypothetical protein